jgi:hypothetical protein
MVLETHHEPLNVDREQKWLNSQRADASVVSIDA